MSTLMTLNIGLAAVAFVLAAWVAVIYVRNHRAIGSPFTLAWALFAVFLLVHNGLLVYHYLTMMATFTPQAEGFLLGEAVLQLAALGALLYAATR